MEITAFYIATDGKDSNPGTKEAPLATLEGARGAIRVLKNTSSLPEGGITVFMRGGVYRLTESFLLEEGDSGMPEKPIAYSAYGDEEVRLIGGVDLPADSFGPVTDPEVRGRLNEQARDRIVQIDLKRLGVVDYGRIVHTGFGLPPSIANPELFFNGQTMAISRYPNSDYVRIENVIDAGGNPRIVDMDPERLAEEQLKGVKLACADPRPFSWKNTGDLWMYGYWYWDWADGNLRIASIDVANRQLHTERASHYSVREGQRYFYYKILEELDAPGEWYLDRMSGLLYFYPPTPIVEGSNIQLSLLGDPMIRLEDVSHVAIKKIMFEASRGSGVQIKGGSHNAVAGCTLCRIGGFAVVLGETSDNGVNAGTDHRVLGCTIYDTGTGGIYLGGGDRLKLTPGRNVASNNDIFNYSRLKRTYSAAIQLKGVGNIAVHNEIHDAPHVGILCNGNDHLIEYNDIYRVLTETGDAGAIYMGRDWTEQGNVIRYNYIHHIHNEETELHIGVYLDDMASGTKIYANVFRDIDLPVLIGGGRNNEMTNNLIVDCQKSLLLDDRAMPGCWAAYHLDEGQVMQERLEAMPYREEPWCSKYPSLMSIWQDEPGTPKFNTVMKNILYQTGPTTYGNYPAYDDTMAIAESAREYGTIEQNFVMNEDLLIIDETEGNISFNEESQSFKGISSFEPIPFKSIELCKEEYRVGNFHSGRIKDEPNKFDKS
ncbi:right-handed parallel beta-helix repeat-containing protein [Paenibacillus macquariensis]|uniref:Right handed beta helix region n=1 Tax=Paenibacillus macquariensis TaxID=948756 RepID=A0ABY1JUZ7_9BACL|nr:right-handed parallel beta-helix repeat-containing protein [Paenibacillus macquariensis]MEC0090869.1 right-handed parallel beta-helix repeat-containing protein [Paenibacillus macquariensis]OAB34601.1 hypothetical protein PMSM_12145 [Paenibacillus macquariensis subsp. macquariensis]SIQ81747.1 Right handed beta helix region [Paenibacillus macquariensis]